METRIVERAAVEELRQVDSAEIARRVVDMQELAAVVRDDPVRYQGFRLGLRDVINRDRFAVVARSTTMQVRNLDFVSAAWCAGCSRFRILTREVLPNIASHLVVVATLEIALAILLEAALSFLGLGVPPPLPSWGLMISEAKDYMFFSPWVIMIPGVALFVLVLGINLLGDGLRDAFGTRQQ